MSEKKLLLKIKKKKRNEILKTITAKESEYTAIVRASISLQYVCSII